MCLIETYHTEYNEIEVYEVKIYPYAEAPRKETAYRTKWTSYADNEPDVFCVNTFGTLEDARNSIPGCYTKGALSRKGYMDIDTGEIFLTFSEMKRDAIDNYDLFDNSNCRHWSDQYKVVKI